VLQYSSALEFAEVIRETPHEQITAAWLPGHNENSTTNMKETTRAISRRSVIHGLSDVPSSAGLLRAKRVKGREKPSKTLHQLLLKPKWLQA
jgi:hypothetical protein